MAKTPSRELERVRDQLESLQYARMVEGSPALEAHRQELSRREVVLLGWDRLARQKRFMKSPA
jgi:hypothetical protein